MQKISGLGGPVAGVGLTGALSLSLHSLLGLLSKLARGQLEIFLHLPGVCFPSLILQLFRQMHLCLASPPSDIFQDMFSKGWSRGQPPREQHDASEINKMLGAKPPGGNKGNMNFSQGSVFPGTTGLHLH